MDAPKDIFSKTINLEKASRYPVAPHWWGLYKYELFGLDEKKDAWKDGNSISGVYIDFYEKFKPDWFHLHIGTPKYLKDSEIFKKLQILLTFRSSSYSFSGNLLFISSNILSNNFTSVGESSFNISA